MLARALDAWWDELRQPDPFIVIEAAAGSGALAAAVLAAGPRCSPALRYVLVERSPTLRERAAEHLPLEAPAMVLGPTRSGPDDEVALIPESGPLLTCLADLPVAAGKGVVIANELLDNLPFVMLERAGDGWVEIRVGEERGALIEVCVPASAALAHTADHLVPDPPPGGRIPIQPSARSWVAAALGVIHAGRVVAIDYGATTAELAARPWDTWVRTYHGHARGGSPLERPGRQDITCDVAVDQLPPVAAQRSQREFLTAHGIGALVESAQAAWRERAHIGDLAALQAKARVSEAAALSDPAGLGSFLVLEWMTS